MRKKRWGRFIGISSNMVGLAIPGMSHGNARSSVESNDSRVIHFMTPFSP
jgi:hypothetical protein